MSTEKIKQQANERQKTFYQKNKKLCQLRVYKTRIKNPIKKELIEIELQKLNNTITQKEIIFIKSLNLITIIKKAPRLKMWNKNLNKWTFKDYSKLQNLLN